MKTINVSTLVGRDAANLFSSMTPEQIQAAPHKTRCPIPESAKGFNLPSDINTFIKDVYPNMVTFVSSKVNWNKELVYETISDFIVYMLSPSRSGTPHWKLYDPEIWSKQPFYKWWFTNLKFFCQSTNRNQFKLFSRHVSIVNKTEEALESGPESTITLDFLSKNIEVYGEDPISNIIVMEVDAFLQKHSRRYTGKRGFDAHAHEMYTALMQGVTKRELAKRLKISISATNQWVEQLRKLIRKIMVEEGSSLIRQTSI